MNMFAFFRDKTTTSTCQGTNIEDIEFNSSQCLQNVIPQILIDNNVQTKLENIDNLEEVIRLVNFLVL